MRPHHWLPPLLWMGVILLLSSDTGSARHTSRIVEPVIRLIWPGVSALQVEALHGLLRKAAHLAEYAVLALLWFRALTGGRGWSLRAAAWAALGISVAWAHLDEAYQALTPSRTGAYGDVLVDTAGATTAAWVAGAGWRRAVDLATTILLWTAAIGGAALVALDLALDVPSGWLGLTTPLAIATLVVRGHGRRRRRRAPAG